MPRKLLAWQLIAIDFLNSVSQYDHWLVARLGAQPFDWLVRAKLCRSDRHKNSGPEKVIWLSRSSHLDALIGKLRF
jgi:hypothetical protein